MIYVFIICLQSNTKRFGCISNYTLKIKKMKITQINFNLIYSDKTHLLRLSYFQSLILRVYAHDHDVHQFLRGFFK